MRVTDATLRREGRSRCEPAARGAWPTRLVGDLPIHEATSMMQLKPVLTSIALLTSLSCMAQDTVKAVLEAGGKRMTAEQVLQAVAGKRMTGKNPAGYETDIQFDKADKFKGTVYPQNGPVQVYGWWRTKDGHLCMDMHYQPRGNNKFCRQVLELKGQYFFAEENAGDDAAASSRKLE
jgi:hypothetical protein